MQNKKTSGLFELTKKATKMAAISTIEMADIAMLNMKLRAQTAKLDQKFELLGCLYYEQRHGSVSNAVEISRLIREIETFKAIIEGIKSEIKAKKDSRSKKKY